MKLYDAEGNLNLDTARHELDSAVNQHNEGVYKKTVAAITAGALLDIARSLRPMGTESALALSDILGSGDEPEPEPDSFGSSVAPEDAYAGTRVRLTAPNDKGEHRTGTLSGVDGFDQDLPWVGVQWDGEEYENGAHYAKVYAANLEVIPADEDVDASTAEADELLGSYPDASPDDVDDDFDDDRRDTDENDGPTALDALEAKTPKKKKAKK